MLRMLLVLILFLSVPTFGEGKHSGYTPTGSQVEDAFELIPLSNNTAGRCDVRFVPVPKQPSVGTGFSPERKLVTSPTPILNRDKTSKKVIPEKTGKGQSADEFHNGRVCASENGEYKVEFETIPSPCEKSSACPVRLMAKVSVDEEPMDAMLTCSSLARIPEQPAGTQRECRLDEGLAGNDYYVELGENGEVAKLFSDVERTSLVSELQCVAPVADANASFQSSDS